MREAARYRVVANGHLPAQQFHGGEDGPDVALLARAFQLEQAFGSSYFPVVDGVGKQLVGEINRGVACGGDTLENRARLGMNFANDARRVFLDYARLLGRDFGKRVAQKLRVVEADVRDYRQQRFDDVRAIEPAAEPYFDDGDVHLFFFEIFESQRGGKLEKTRAEGLEKGALLLDKTDDPFFGNRHAIDADALAEIEQVRRGVQARVQALTLQDRGKRVRATALAVGARDVNHGVMAVGVAEMIVERDSVRHALLIRRSTRFLEGGRRVVEVVDDFGVSAHEL